jgi:hypothetical protein
MTDREVIVTKSLERFQKKSKKKKKFKEKEKIKENKKLK